MQSMGSQRVGQDLATENNKNPPSGFVERINVVNTSKYVKNAQHTLVTQQLLSFLSRIIFQEDFSYSILCSGPVLPSQPIVFRMLL